MRLIDADALVKELRDLYKQQNWNYKEVHLSLSDMEKNILFVPTIEPRKGKWIDDNCSVCGQYVYHGDARNYCPNCGAKMNS